MQRRNLIRTAAAVLALALAVAFASAQQITLKAADDQPPSYPTVKALNFMGKMLEQLSGGTMTMKVYPSGQLGNEQSTIEQTQAGVIDIDRINAAPLANFDKKLGVLSLPYIFTSKSQFWDVLNGPVGLKLLDSLKTAKMVGLAYYDSGQRSFYTTKKAGPIKSVADLKGKRIRVQKSQVMIDMVKALGATPVPMAFGDVYSSLQSGVIDGAENNIPSYGPFGVRHYEVAPYYTFDSHSRVPEIVLISQKTWDKLNAQQQAWVREAALASVPIEEAAWNALVQKTTDALQGKVTYFHPDTKAFQDAMKPVYDQYQASLGSLITEIINTK